MPKSKLPWREKLLDDKDLPKVSVTEGKPSKRWDNRTCVIPALREVNETMKSVPIGRLITTKEIQSVIALKRKTTMACPLNCGILAWIAANAAHEKETKGTMRITPYWLTLKLGGVPNPKFPDGVLVLKARLEAEGFRVITKLKKWLVADYESYLVSLTSKGRTNSADWASQKVRPAKFAG
ncbi:MAG: hypothetical protein NT013_07445 [Planctomycetia bacterium]|nr:hypothetical protein [Planctomycetia bacterium]